MKTLTLPLTVLIALSVACGSSHTPNTNEDANNASGNNNNQSTENEGNHSTEPRQAAGMDYPGNTDSASAGTHSPAPDQK